LRFVSHADGAGHYRDSIGLRHCGEPYVAIRNVFTVAFDFCWFAIVEDFLLPASATVRKRALAAAIAAAILLSAGMDVLGWRYLAERDRDLVRGMAAFDHSSAGPVLPMPGQSASMDEFDKRARVILEESIRLGIYRPPAY
jgi:hypothetical protein